MNIIEIFKLFGSIFIDSGEADRSIAKTEGKAESLAGKFGSGIVTAAKWGAAIVVGAAGAAVAIGALAAPLVQAAADATAMNAQFEQVFGKLETKAQSTLDSLGADFGMLPSRLKPSFTKITSMFKGFGMSTEEAMAAAGNAVTLAADAAAFYDVSLDTADGALTSFLKGNTNAAESIGIFATAAGMASFASDELGLNWKKLDEGGKQLVRLKYVEKMQEAAGATGQAARESDGLENVMGNLRQAWEDMKVKFGTPILEPAVDGIMKLTDAMMKVDTDKVIAKFEAFISFVQVNLVGNFNKAKDAILSFYEVFKTGDVGNILEKLGLSSEAATKVEAFISVVKDGFKNLMTNMQPLFETIKGAFQNLVDSIGPTWENLKTLFESLKPILELVSELVAIVLVSAFGIAIATFNAVVAAVGPLINAVINFVDVIANVVNAVIALMKGDLSGAMEFWQKATESSLEFIKNLWEGVVTYISTFVQTIVDYFHGLYMTLVGNSIVPDIVNEIVKWFKDMFTWVIDVVKNIVDGVIKWFTDLKDKAIAIFETLKTFFATVWDGVQTIFSTVVKAIVDFVKTSFDNLMNNIKTIFEAVKSVITGAWDFIQNTFKTILSAILSLVKGDFEGMKNAIKSQMDNAKTLISTIWNGIKTLFSTVLGNLVTTVENKFGEFVGKIKEKMTEVKTKISEKWEEVMVFFRGIDLLQTGKDIVSGLIGGIGDMFGKVKTKVSELANLIPDWARDILGIHSPSLVFKEIGKFVGLGLALGIDETKAANEKAIAGVAKVLSAAARKNADEITQIGTEAEKARTVIQKEYAIKRAELAKSSAQSSQAALKTHKNKKGVIVTTGEQKVYKIRQDASAKLTKLNEDEQKKLASINEKAWADMAKKENELAKERLEAVKTYVADKRSLDELSLVAEAEVWRKSLALFQVGTKERVEVQKGYQAALKAVNDEIAKTNDEYAGKMTAINDRLRKEEEDLTSVYTKSLGDRMSSLMSFAGLFDEFDIKVEKSGAELLSNLNAQVDGFKLWQTEIEKLSSKAIDDGLIAELREMGPKALPELLALNSLTDVQLTQYSALYQEKSKLARTQAEAELIGMKTDTALRITELRATANIELEALRAEWVLKIQAVTKATDDELKSLKDIGVNAGLGLLSGLASMEASLVAKARSIAEAVKNAMAGAFDINSPSRWMRDMIGKNMMLGWMGGMESMRSNVIGVAKKAAEWMTPSTPNLAAFVTPKSVGNGSPIRAADTFGGVNRGDTYHIDNVVIDGKTVAVMQHAEEFFTKIKQTVNAK